MRRLSADMHRGQRASLGNQVNHAIKAGYKGAADFFAAQHKFFLLSGRHPYKTRMQKVLVTGGSGFLGAWIIRRLARRGIAARVFDISDQRRIVAEVAGPALAQSLDWQVGDIRDGAAVRRAAEGCEGIVHLAGILIPACAADPVRGA